MFTVSSDLLVPYWTNEMKLLLSPRVRIDGFLRPFELTF